VFTKLINTLQHHTDTLAQLSRLYMYKEAIYCYGDTSIR